MELDGREVVNLGGFDVDAQEVAFIFFLVRELPQLTIGSNGRTG